MSSVPDPCKDARMGHPLTTPRRIVEVVSSRGRSSEKKKEGEEVWATRPACQHRTRGKKPYSEYKALAPRIQKLFQDKP